MNKKLIATSACAAAVTASVLAGPAPMESAKTVIEPAAPGFEAARRPMTNPTLFDLAVPRTGIHAIYMHQRMPSKISSELGKLDLDGIVWRAAFGRSIFSPTRGNLCSNMSW